MHWKHLTIYLHRLVTLGWMIGHLANGTFIGKVFVNPPFNSDPAKAVAHLILILTLIPISILSRLALAPGPPGIVKDDARDSKSRNAKKD